MTQLEDQYSVAVRLFEAARGAVSAMSGGNPIAQRDDRWVRSLVETPALYEHFKSTPENPKQYVVLSVAKEVDTDDDYRVVYFALYPPHAGKLATRILVDPKKGFLLPVKGHKDVPLYAGPRFRLVKKLSRGELSQYLKRYWY